MTTRHDIKVNGSTLVKSITVTKFKSGIIKLEVSSNNILGVKIDILPHSPNLLNVFTEDHFHAFKNEKETIEVSELPSAYGDVDLRQYTQVVPANKHISTYMYGCLILIPNKSMQVL